MDINSWILLVGVSICVIALVGALLMRLWFYMKDRQHLHKAQFIGDLYRLQHKWSKKGQTEYAEGISVIIRGFSMEEKDIPLTDEGRRFYKRMLDERNQ